MLVSSLAFEEHRRTKGENQSQLVVACAKPTTRGRKCADVTKPVHLVRALPAEGMTVEERGTPKKVRVARPDEPSAQSGFLFDV